MPLTYLLYRCPRCGHDPLEGEKDEAYCAACRFAFVRGGPGGLIRIQGPSGSVWEVPGHRVVSAMEAWDEGSKEAKAWGPGDSFSAKVRVRQSGKESPVRWGGQLLGFAEAMGPAMEGVLTLSGEEITLEASDRADSAVGQGAPHPAMRWPLKEVRAVQTSSSSLQFSPVSGGLVEFRFLEDSPFRWETLLRQALRSLYRRKELGEIVEFQPRIVTE